MNYVALQTCVASNGFCPDASLCDTTAKRFVPCSPGAVMGWPASSAQRYEQRLSLGGGLRILFRAEEEAPFDIDLLDVGEAPRAEKVRQFDGNLRAAVEKIGLNLLEALNKLFMQHFVEGKIRVLHRGTRVPGASTISVKRPTCCG